MNKIEEIFRAWNIAIDPTTKQAELASRRLDICNGCEYKVTNLGINRCSACGCALKGKIFTPAVGACPKGKWDEVDAEMIDQNKPMIQEIEDQLTQEDCQGIIDSVKDKMKVAGVLGSTENNYRIAEQAWIHENNPLTLKIKNIVLHKTNLPVENQEAIHIVRYGVGGQYKPHHDFFHPNTSYYENATKNGGQRKYSCLFYLNDNFKGGETEFPKQDLMVKPKTGKLLMWDNLKKDGSPNHDTLHAGLPVTEGEKWICIVWVREDRY